ncbi:LysR family transcriptional regulator [Achromobacter insolitus]|uniref:LysR family transcriptional regulator n=1 Tax=Achromobacter insolitus TaxID=217204 RepID=UPI000CEB41F8|nr:LysR family transcriptional regulator [Achromobacter insolitus]AVG41214.1 LysR family transcriptional regulator [Achromobacter insolitus]NGT13111.1 LysR family transcriptional regulator [Achromobacter insolitus]QEK91227.1 LysR family transcriptional regulator [Achromobacter insolitus]
MKHIPSAIPDLRVLRQFLAVSEYGSLRKAAEMLQMSQPPLSVAMRQLEQTVGTQLFARSALGVQLTAAGNVLKAEAEKLIAHGVRAFEMARAVGQGELGEVRIGFITSAMVDLLPAVLARFSSSHPGIRLRLVEGVSIEVASMVDEGKVDLGVLTPPVPYPAASTHFQVARDRLVALLPRGHMLASRKAIRLEALKNERFVSFSTTRVPAFHQRITGACLEAGFQPQIVQEAAHIHTIIALVAGKLGVALVPATAARSARKDVIAVPISDRSKLLDTSLEVVYLEESLTAAGRAFLAHLQVPGSELKQGS